jgi:hypothetical protein
MGTHHSKLALGEQWNIIPSSALGSVTPGDPYTTGEQIATNTAVYFAAGDTSVGFTPICGVVSIVVHGNEIES